MFGKTALALTAVAAVANAQLASLPSCASSAVGPAISAVGATGCQVTDTACLCQHGQQLLGALEPVLAQDCSQAEVSSTPVPWSRECNSC